jgi:hypothetical protein
LEAGEKLRIVAEMRREQELREDFHATLSERVARSLRVEQHPRTANTHFASASAECLETFRDGYFYGCIALTQAVAEALARFMCRKKRWRPAEHFEENVQVLFTRRAISETVKEQFLQIWSDRDAYHHLNPGVETDREKLEALAFDKVRLLNEIEKEVFAFQPTKDGVALKHPEYWDTRDEGPPATFLRYRH